jgi:outer membrane biosynthesis protein TonB
MTSDCHTRYVRSNHSGFLNAAANAAGTELPVELELVLEPGCELEPVEPKPDAEGESDPDEVDPPATEPPPAVEAPPARRPPRQEDEDEEKEEEDEEEDEGEKPRFGSAPAGVASKSTNTSPKMCSTYCAGTPGGLTGWVNTTCSPVAVTVSSPPEFVVPMFEPI